MDRYAIIQCIIDFIQSSNPTVSFQQFRDELVLHQSDQDWQAEKLEEYLQWMRALPNQDMHALITTLRKDLKLDFYHLAYYDQPSFTQLLQKGVIKNNAQHAMALFYLLNVPSDRQSPKWQEN